MDICTDLLIAVICNNKKIMNCKLTCHAPCILLYIHPISAHLNIIVQFPFRNTELFCGPTQSFYNVLFIFFFVFVFALNIFPGFGLINVSRELCYLQLHSFEAVEEGRNDSGRGARKRWHRANASAVFGEVCSTSGRSVRANINDRGVTT